MSERTVSSYSVEPDGGRTGSAKSTASGVRWNSKQLAGFILILIGAIFLLANLGFLWWWNWGTMWPTLLIGIGLFILASSVNLRNRA